MLPFAETVLAWRLERGMTQAALARASGVPRPNLSAIERGEREVTLKTLRALAAALDVRPGVLADGCAPGGDPRPLTRRALERIAMAAAVPGGGGALADRREASLVISLRAAMSSRIAASGTGESRPVRAGVGRRGRSRARTADRAYFILRATEPSEVIASLVERTSEHLARK